MEVRQKKKKILKIHKIKRIKKMPMYFKKQAKKIQIKLLRLGS